MITSSEKERKRKDIISVISLLQVHRLLDELTQNIFFYKNMFMLYEQFETNHIELGGTTDSFGPPKSKYDECNFEHVDK